MANAQICDCGHQRTDHRHSQKKGHEGYQECEHIDCDCLKFNYNHSKASAWKNQGPPQNTNESWHEFDKPLSSMKKYKKEEVFLADCSPEGFARSHKLRAKKPMCNNGEYL